jgi:hypothetical protein
VKGFLEETRKRDAHKAAEVPAEAAEGAPVATPASP